MTVQALSLAPAHADGLDARYVEAFEHNVAHAQRATRAGQSAKRAAVAAAVLALFTGTTWTGDLAGAGLFSSTLIQVVAAVAAFAAAAVASLSAAFHWSDDQKEHATAAQCWAGVMLDIEKARSCPGNAALSEVLGQDEAAARQADKDADLCAEDFQRARDWIIHAAEERERAVEALRKLGALPG